MLNRIWQAEEVKWERRRTRAEKALAHIQELKKLEAEEEAEEGVGVVSAAGQPKVAAGQAAGRVEAAAGQADAAAGPTTVPLLPSNESRREEGAKSAKKSTRDALPELLRERSPQTMNALAEALGVSAQAVANGLAVLTEQGVIVREPSTFPGHRYQFRLATKEDLESFAKDGGQTEIMS